MNYQINQGKAVIAITALVAIVGITAIATTVKRRRLTLGNMEMYTCDDFNEEQEEA